MPQQIFTAQFWTQKNKPRGFQGTRLMYTAKQELHQQRQR